MSNYHRRDFLKLLATLPAAYALRKWLPVDAHQGVRSVGGKPNVIILLFDALSAYNVSLYGYPRRTTPNLERFAERANTYHAHYSTANFTVPGVSSLLTGLYPWTHRAVNLSGLVQRDLADHNIFERTGEGYHRLAFSQNVMATNLLNQFQAGIDEILPSSSFSEISFLTSEYFRNSPNAAYQVNDHLLFDMIDSPASLIFGVAQRVMFENQKRFKRDYPRGIPQPREYPIVYRLDNLFNGLMKKIDDVSQPFISYIHIFSPHAPYRARRDFIGLFDDGWTQIKKPDHAITEGESYETTEQNRVWYDEYIANVDFEFGRFLDHLEETGMLENTHLIVTSDHGELLERGVKGHVTPLLYEPLVRVPLLISSPGQTQANEIYTPTSSVDLLPTLLALTGQQIPDWAEGELLPGLGGEENAERDIYMLEAKSNSAFRPLSHFTLAMRKGRYKIIMYRGYEVFGKDVFELYDLQNDPEEMNDLFSKESALANDLKTELIKKLDEINKAHSA
ncbi:MAG TPA: sulfatase [Anaerolineales bacterium]